MGELCLREGKLKAWDCFFYDVSQRLWKMREEMGNKHIKVLRRMAVLEIGALQSDRGISPKQ